VLRTDGLSKSFGSLAVTRNVNLELARGERRALIGPNGAGKTTLFDLLTGELKPDRGRVFFGSRDITKTSPDFRARAGIARSFQKNNLFGDLSVLENLTVAVVIASGAGHVFWRALRKQSKIRDRAIEFARTVGIEDHLGERVSNLSYGLQRHLEVGLALAVDPVVLMLDEPTAGMTPEETAAMKSLIRSLPGSLSVLMVEHDMDVVFDIMDQVTVLDYGTILFEGTPEQARESEVVRERYLGEAR
jgi:ABC-type branched-subunit amino acid transport system ATPase component